MPIAVDSEQRYDYGLPSYLEGGLTNFLNAKVPAAWQEAGLIVDAEDIGVDYNAKAARNSALLTAALARYRLVTISKPGQYLFVGPGQESILIPKNTALVSLAGVELILADNSQTPLIRSAESWHSTPITLSGAIVFGSLGSGLSGTCSATGIGTKHPAGSWVAIVGLNHATVANRSYVGVFQVFSAPDANTIVVNLVDWPASSANSSTGALVYPVDTGMRIIGGLWDGNDVGQGAPGYPAGDPREHTMHFRHSQNVIVRDVEFRRGMSWSIGVNHIRDCTFEHLSGDLYTDGLGAADVLFQGSGGGRNVVVRDVAGSAKDNLVAWSLDVGGVYANHYPGDTYDIKFEDIELQTQGVAGIAIWGNTDYRHNSFTVENVHGRTRSEGCVKVDCGYAPTSMLNARGGKLTIKNINGFCASSVVNIRSDGDWDHIEIDGVRNGRNNVHANAPLVLINRNTTTQVIDRVDIRNLQHVSAGSTINRSAPAVTITDTTINTLNIEKMPTMRLAANVALIAHTGTAGTIGKMVVSSVSAIANAAGDCCLVSCENTLAGAIGQLTLRDSTFNAFDASGGLIRQSATGKVTKIRSDNNTITGSTGEVSAAVTVGSGVIRDGTGASLDVVSVVTT